MQLSVWAALRPAGEPPGFRGLWQAHWRVLATGPKHTLHINLVIVRYLEQVPKSSLECTSVTSHIYFLIKRVPATS